MITWLLTNKIETIWATKVLEYMLKIHRKGSAWLPYGDLIMNI